MKKIMATLTETTLSNSASVQTCTLKSTERGDQLTNNQQYNGVGFSGENHSPQLYWEHAPSEMKSFAVTMYDIDSGQSFASGLWAKTVGS